MIPVAVYCRVSTDREDQANSFASQQSYFREYIARNPQWELYRIYADEGITGTSTRKRQEFNRMINDGFSGKFRLILTKEVSRFSRNILDTIGYTRQLKARGIGVIFMTDGFSSLDPDAELRLSIMGSLAQEESRKTSARVKWGQTRQMEKGVVFGRSMLGYDLKDGRITVNPTGATLVGRIFHMYGIEKKGSTTIARILDSEGVPTFSGQSRWTGSRILKVLKNEKYVGDLIQKKTFTPDYLTHDKKYNHGEEPFVIARDHHEPIISRELWQIVQEQIQKRNRHAGKTSQSGGTQLFSGKIRCGVCGSPFVCRRKRRKNGSVYLFWRCAAAVSHGTAGCGIGKNLSNQRAIEMLSVTVREAIPEPSEYIRNVSRLAGKAWSALEGQENNSREKEISRKREVAVRSYLSGELTEKDLSRIRRQLDEELCEHTKRSIPDFRSILEKMFRCDPPSDAFLRQLVDVLTVYPDGSVTVRLLNHPREHRFSQR